MDSNDRERVSEARDELHRMLNEVRPAGSARTLLAVAHIVIVSDVGSFAYVAEREASRSSPCTTQCALHVADHSHLCPIALMLTFKVP